ncbi:Elicitor-responsive protein 3 [Forsythia ovata]|uniref:Elicitor-responsive protein 3 n=1 Tax=Forsythia ovata TaxID=205694 RepID=A0ABD1W3L5_9LAMI
MHAATTFSCASPPPNASHRRHSTTRQKKMVRGTLEVLLVCAKGIENTDFLCNMDPYVIITCRTQEHKSSVASGKGSDPEWNENFVFALSDDVPELLIKIMDSDGTSEDDFVGEAKKVVKRRGLMHKKKTMGDGKSLHIELKTATLTLVLVALLIVALSSVDSALSYLLALLLRRKA